MNIAWDRRTHNWDDDIILRTMMLGDDANISDMRKNVEEKRLKSVFEKKHNQLDRKSQVFWGHMLGITPSKPAFTHRFYAPTPSRHITP